MHKQCHIYAALWEVLQQQPRSDFRSFFWVAMARAAIRHLARRGCKRARGGAVDCTGRAESAYNSPGAAADGWRNSVIAEVEEETRVVRV